MLRTRRLAPLLLLPATLLASSVREDNLAFAPEEGSEVQKSFSSNMDLDMDDLSIVVDGQDLGAMLGSMEMSLSTEVESTVTDRYDAVAEGKPAKLTRSFDAVGGNVSMSVASEMGGDDQSQPLESELAGSTVVFSWDEDAGEYVVSFEDDDGDESLLEGLEEDMDLRALLPSDEVSEDDSWEVPIEELSSIALPGGTLGVGAGEGDEETPEFIQDILNEGTEGALGDLLDGSCTCTYKGSRDEDGVTVGEIDVVISIEGSADLTEMLSDMVDAMSDEFGEEFPEITFDSADLSVDFEGEGVLLWDLGAGRVHSFDMSGTGGLALDVSVSGEMNGEGGSADISVEFSGTVSQSVETE